MAPTNRNDNKDKKHSVKRPKAKPNDSDHEEPPAVTLKPLFGISPGAYVTLLLAAALLLALFVLL
ncbi:MAG: hypothetical protein ACLFM0_09500 [Spirochaetales bacterium]